MEQWREALEEGVKDTMWACFWKGRQTANLPQLEELCLMLIRATTQKTAGQKKAIKDIDWDNVGMIYNMIAVEACCLVLDERFEGLKEAWEKENRNE